MLPQNIFKLPVSVIAEKIKNREFSSVELTRSLIDYAKVMNKKTNAYISFREEEALREAQNADDQIKNGNYRGQYHGIPMGIKDNIYLKDEVTTMGSKIHKDFVPGQDAEVVQKLREAGAVIIGKLNLHEYAWGVTSNNPHFGPTHNPWNLSKITGGSSGGAGAAIASGASFASIGTDTAGSVRIPASCCGIVGLKPTQELISRDGVFPLSHSLDHVGPMGRTVSDVAALLEILAISHKEVHAPDYTSRLTGDIRGYTIGVNEEYYLSHLDDKVETLVRKEIERLKSDGIKVVPVQIPTLEHVAFIGYMTILSESFTVHEENLKDRIGDFGEDIQGLYQMGIPSAVDYIKAQQIARKLKTEFEAAFSAVDALLTPTLPCLPPDIGSTTVTINGKEEDLNNHIMRFMFPGNVTGLPSLSLPGGMADGLPVGLQIIGPEFSEAKILNIGKAIEDHVRFDYGKVIV